MVAAALCVLFFPHPFAQSQIPTTHQCYRRTEQKEASECLFKGYLVKYNHFVLVWDSISAYQR